ncbi:hypothetical protein [uncultured Psychrobacillus sp.]|uniref:hypothetical protein n=1 Tax=uncultured Psychrobacillus sp. TaxID=1551585 RepID=UPI002631D6AA|nr:hypothetical protein [uncultured Psychrobacillus sp.]
MEILNQYASPFTSSPLVLLNKRLDKTADLDNFSLEPDNQLTLLRYDELIDGIFL